MHASLTLEEDADELTIAMFNLAGFFARANFPVKLEIVRQPDFGAKIQKRAALGNVLDRASDRRAPVDADDGMIVGLAAAKGAALSALRGDDSFRNDS